MYSYLHSCRCANVQTRVRACEHACTYAITHACIRVCDAAHLRAVVAEYPFEAVPAVQWRLANSGLR